MSLTLGAIARSVVRGDPLPVDTSLDALGEIDQQIAIAISGSASDTIAWAELNLTFDVEFLDAVQQRYSNMTTPLFTYGSVIDSEGGPVGVLACVTAWETDERGVTVGAVVSIGAFSPGTTTGFSGYAHLRFDGYGSIPNEPADPSFEP